MPDTVTRSFSVRNITVVLKNGNVKDVIKLPGIWPGAISNGEYNQEGGLVKVSVSLKVSKAIYLTREEFMQ